jgi:hypothetical protein
MSKQSGLDYLVVIDLPKCLLHLSLPKEGFIEHVNCIVPLQLGLHRLAFESYSSTMMNAMKSNNHNLSETGVLLRETRSLCSSSFKSSSSIYCRVSHALKLGMSTPPFCSVVDMKAFRPQCRLRNLLRRTKSTHKAHRSNFYPGPGHPLANNPTSCFRGFSGVHSVQDDEQ